MCISVHLYAIKNHYYYFSVLPSNTICLNKTWRVNCIKNYKWGKEQLYSKSIPPLMSCRILSCNSLTDSFTKSLFCIFSFSTFHGDFSVTKSAICKSDTRNQNWETKKQTTLYQLYWEKNPSKLWESHPIGEEEICRECSQSNIKLSYYHAWD